MSMLGTSLRHYRFWIFGPWNVGRTGHSIPYMPVYILYIVSEFFASW